MRRNHWAIIVVLAAGGVGYLKLSAFADGIPDEGALRYEGLLEEQGEAVSGDRLVGVSFWSDADDDSDGARQCSVAPRTIPVASGHFSIPLGTDCVDAVRANADLWVQVSVGGEPVGRSKLGAVPYAGEAGRAAGAAGALQDQLDTLAAHTVPVGGVLPYAGEAAPPGWLLCNGAEVSRDEHAALLAAIGTAHGAGDGATTFNLPDYRGRFLRGVDDRAGRDPDSELRVAAGDGGNGGDAVGSVQESAIQGHGHVGTGHTHGGTAASAGAHVHQIPRNTGPPGPRGQLIQMPDGDAGHQCTDVTRCPSAGAHAHQIQTDSASVTVGEPVALPEAALSISAEPRPPNAYVHWIIKV